MENERKKRNKAKRKAKEKRKAKREVEIIEKCKIGKCVVMEIFANGKMKIIKNIRK